MKRIHFEELSGIEFERLVYSYVKSLLEWKSLEWPGEAGDDGGSDLWGVAENGETYCYQCKNHHNRPLSFSAVKKSIQSLLTSGRAPDHYILVCGGKVSNKLRSNILDFLEGVISSKVEVWTGSEFEMRLNTETPELVREEGIEKKIKRAINFEQATVPPKHWKPTFALVAYMLLGGIAFILFVFWINGMMMQRSFNNVADWLGIPALIIFGYTIFKIFDLNKKGKAHLPVEFMIFGVKVERVFSEQLPEIKRDSKGGKYSVTKEIHKIQLMFSNGVRDVYPLSEMIKRKIKEGDVGLAFISEFGRLVDLRYLSINEEGQPILV